MIDLKFFFKNLFFIFKFISLFFVLFVLQVTPQPKEKLAPKVSISKNNFDLSVPFRECFQILNGNIVEVDFASDKKEAVFIPLKGGRVVKINLTEQNQVWVSNLGGEITSNLKFQEGKVFLITKVSEDKLKRNLDSNKNLINYILWSLDATTGLTDWQLNFTSDSTVNLDIHQNKIFLIAKNGTISSVKTNGTLDTLNKNFAATSGSTPIFQDNKIYIGTEENLILMISTDKVEVSSKILFTQSPVSALAVAEDRLLWGERNGFVNSFDIDTKKIIWNVRYGGEISSLTIVPSGVLVTSFDNFVYLNSLQKGKNIWRRRLAGRILAKPLIVENFAVLITNISSNAIIMDLSNGKIVNQISLVNSGFNLSQPLVLKNSLVFSTNKGLFSFAPTNVACSQN